MEAGDLLAVTDTAAVVAARLDEARAESELAALEADSARARADEACVRAEVAAREAERRARLHEQGVAGEEEAERARGEAEASAASCTAMTAAVRSAEAVVRVRAAQEVRIQAELERSWVRAPSAGRILQILVYPGEVIREAGVLEMARAGPMYAVAEVYETDIRYVRLGQTARVSSPALPKDITGVVSLIRPKVQKMDELDTDPAARKDARIIEVKVRLEGDSEAERLINLQVDVVIEP